MRKLIITLITVSLLALSSMSFAKDLPIYDQGNISTESKDISQDKKATYDYLTVYRHKEFMLKFSTPGNEKILRRSQLYKLAEGISGPMFGIRVNFESAP